MSYKSRVIRDEKITPYVAEIRSKREDSSKYWLVFKFSSIFNMDRFIDGLKEFIETESLKLNSRYHVKFNIYDDLAISYYKRIEKRIFSVEYKEEQK